MAIRTETERGPMIVESLAKYFAPIYGSSEMALEAYKKPWTIMGTWAGAMSQTVLTYKGDLIINPGDPQLLRVEVDYPSVIRSKGYALKFREHVNNSWQNGLGEIIQESLISPSIEMAQEIEAFAPDAVWLQEVPLIPTTVLSRRIGGINEDTRITGLLQRTDKCYQTGYTNVKNLAYGVLTDPNFSLPVELLSESGYIDRRFLYKIGINCQPGERIKLDDIVRFVQENSGEMERFGTMGRLLQFISDIGQTYTYFNAKQSHLYGGPVALPQYLEDGFITLPKARLDLLGFTINTDNEYERTQITDDLKRFIKLKNSVLFNNKSLLEYDSLTEEEIDTYGRILKYVFDKKLIMNFVEIKNNFHYETRIGKRIHRITFSDEISPKHYHDIAHSLFSLINSAALTAFRSKVFEDDPEVQQFLMDIKSVYSSDVRIRRQAVVNVAKFVKNKFLSSPNQVILARGYHPMLGYTPEPGDKIVNSAGLAIRNLTDDVNNFILPPSHIPKVDVLNPKIIYLYVAIHAERMAQVIRSSVELNKNKQPIPVHMKQFVESE